MHRLIVDQNAALSSDCIPFIRRPHGVWTIALLLLCFASGCGRYSWRVEDHYYAAERGRVLRFMRVEVRSNSPFDDGTSVLVEPCGTDQMEEDKVPCWPAEPSQKVQRWWKYGAPWYRDPYSLRSPAESFNRRIGAGKSAYVIGTEPLAMALLEDRPGRLESYRELARAQTRPAFHPAGRKALFVTEHDLAAPANVVLMFPPGMNLSEITLETWGAKGPPIAELRLLREPASLLQCMQAIAELHKLGPTGQEVYQIPVSNW